MSLIEFDGVDGLKVSLVLSYIEGVKQVSLEAAKVDVIVQDKAYRVAGAYVDIKAQIESALSQD
jgi:hypothetical protein